MPVGGNYCSPYLYPYLHDAYPILNLIMRQFSQPQVKLLGSHARLHDNVSETDGVMTNCNSLPPLSCLSRGKNSCSETEVPNTDEGGGGTEREREEVLLPWPLNLACEIASEQQRCLPLTNLAL